MSDPTSYTPQTETATDYTKQTTTGTIQGEGGIPVSQLYDDAAVVYDLSTNTYDGITAHQLEQIRSGATAWGAM